jgi:hypothetical protein
MALLLELLELGDDVLGAARAQLALAKDGDVAEHTLRWAAAGGLHAGEALAGQNRRDAQSFEKVDRQALAIRKRPLVEVSLGWPIGVAAHDGYTG